jgi:hypothetical protein
MNQAGMRYIATRWICDQTPKGAEIDLPESDGELLVALGFVRRGDAPTSAEAPASNDSSPSRRRYRTRHLVSEAP